MEADKSSSFRYLSIFLSLASAWTSPQQQQGNAGKVDFTHLAQVSVSVFLTNLLRFRLTAAANKDEDRLEVDSPRHSADYLQIKKLLTC